MKLSVQNWADLAGILDKLPQAELASTAEVRQCIGSIEQIRSSLPKEYKEEQDEINDKSNKIIKKFQEELRAIPEDKKEEREALVTLYNTKNLAPISEELNELNKKFSEQELNIDLDKNYLSFIKNVWEKHIRPQYRVPSVMISVADALNI